MDIKRVLKWSLTECFAILTLYAGLGIGSERILYNYDLQLPDWPECPESAKCVNYMSNNSLSRKYIIDGQSFKLSFPKMENTLVITCDDNATLNIDSMPRFKNKTTFQAMKLESCDVPSSYNRLIITLNTTSVMRLYLIFNKPVTLAMQHFENLSLKSLTIKHQGVGLIYLEDGALEAISTLYSVTLENVSLPTLLPANQIQVLSILGGKSRGDFGFCDKLKNLEIKQLQLKDDKIPTKWISKCGQLKFLSISNIVLREWPVDMLWGATELETILIFNVALKELTSPVLMDAKKLKYLYLSNNSLTYLPRDIFSSLHVLEGLKLNHNPIGDMCDKGKGSVFENLVTLNEIYLRNTGATRLCSEWKLQLPSLIKIDMSLNYIEEIKFRDINWLRRNETHLDLTSNPLKTIFYNKEDYEILRSEPKNTTNELLHKKHLYFNLDSTLACDCRSFWFALAMKNFPDHIYFPRKPKCENNEDVHFDAYFSRTRNTATCRVPQNECAEACECYKDVNHDPVEANCTGAALHKLPIIINMEKLYAANNKIESIEKLPDTLKFINLENNLISHLDEAAISTLFGTGRRYLRLAGNPFSCRCKDFALIRALQTHQEQIIDYDIVTCINKQSISSIDLQDLCKLDLTTFISSILGSLAAVTVILGVVCYRYKFEIKIYMFNKGWCSRWICEEELDSGKLYDAFISYSYLDEEFVFKQIINKLENEELGFRLCANSRDWAVGEYIPDRIAESVNLSKRTIVVLSINFLKSDWGRLELRMAHMSAMMEGRSRIIVVILDDVDVLQDGIDDELLTYLATSTYVKWGDPQFHAKLRYALPHRRGEHLIQQAYDNVVAAEELSAAYEINTE